MVGVRGWHGGRLSPTEQAEEGRQVKPRTARPQLRSSMDTSENDLSSLQPVQANALDFQLVLIYNDEAIHNAIGGNFPVEQG